MKLVLYGGGDEKDNQELDSALVKLVQTKNPRITYIPSCSYDAEIDFRYFVRQYQKFNIRKFLYLPIDLPFDPVLFKEAINSDIIHLSGGNTFYFLKHLRKSGLIPELRKFVSAGGILTGLSAGAILMTPNVDTAGLPDFDRDENEDNVLNFRAMNLVQFEVFPHYKNSKRYDFEILNHSKETPFPIYACPDGAGIIVDNFSISFFGKVFCFYKGRKVNVRGRAA